MTRTEHLLAIVAEECDEVSQRCIKALRFSLAEIQPDQDHTNSWRIMQEYADLLGAMELLKHEPDFYPFFLDQSGVIRGMVEAKKSKIEEFLKLSAKMGTLL